MDSTCESCSPGTSATKPLQYLNARYYDPELGMFLQPDWFEVTKTGVGTNRYSYSFNDPINKLDPGENWARAEKAWGNFKGSLKAAWNDPEQALKGAAKSAAKDHANMVPAVKVASEIGSLLSPEIDNLYHGEMEAAETGGSIVYSGASLLLGGAGSINGAQGTAILAESAIEPGTALVPKATRMLGKWGGESPFCLLRQCWYCP